MLYNALTFNLQDYFHCPASAGPLADLQRRQWPPRLEQTLEYICRELDHRQVRATFFVTGQLAQQHHHLVRRLAQDGHEIASQAMTHQSLLQTSPEQFQQQLQKSKTILEDIIRQPVLGFRAADFSLAPSTLWALDIINRLGFEYDSSIFPVSHELFGIPDASPLLHYATGLEGARIVEFPPLTAALWRHRLPVGAAPYLRFIPAPWVCQLIRRRNRIGHAALVSFNTCEFDPRQPRLALPLGSRLIKYYNLSRTMSKLKYLLEHYPFAPAATAVKESEKLEAQQLSKTKDNY